MPSTPRLDRLDAMQRAPLGTFSALRRPSPVATQYKRQAEMYGQALRTLRRAARRGDPNAAMAGIKLRDQANEDGFAPGGIQRSEDFQGNVADREQSLMQRNQDLQAANQLDRKFGSSVLNRGSAAMTSPNDATGPELMGPPESARNTRISSALDILEGRLSDGAEQYTRGKETARSLGVENPDSILSGDSNLKYRQTLDMALGQAKTPEEVAALKERGSKFGISSKAFDRRAKWWDSNR